MEAQPAVLAGTGVTLIEIVLAIVPFPATRAAAVVHVDWNIGIIVRIRADGTVVARRLCALVVVDIAQLACPTWLTGTAAEPKCVSHTRRVMATRRASDRSTQLQLGIRKLQDAASRHTITLYDRRRDTLSTSWVLAVAATT